jgi:cytochrome b561
MQKYTWPAVTLHWVMAILVLGMLALGLYMADLPKGTERSTLIGWHKSIGLSLVLLLALRIAWRAAHPPPPYPAQMPPWQRRLAHLNAAALYTLLVLQPLSGYLSSSFSGYQTRFFGLALPQWGHEDPALNTIFNNAHVLCSRLLMALITLHVAGAATHALVRRDGVVRRMWFGDSGA